jgi:hypothetical protein
VFFDRWVAPLSGLEWQGLYPIWGVWFPSRMPLEGTNRIQNFML